MTDAQEDVGDQRRSSHFDMIAKSRDCDDDQGMDQVPHNTVDAFDGIAFLNAADVRARGIAIDDYAILDTPPEPEFDDIVSVARKVCDTPVALISLIDLNRQWFKARIGFAPCETPLGQSVCAHALQQPDDLLVIPDLELDPRTKDNGLVVGEPYIRFYAGTVLKTLQGIALGTLCVIDTKPRPFGLAFEQADALRALGRQTMAMMAMRRAVNERVEALVGEREARRASVERAKTIQAEAERVRLDEARSKLAQQAGGIGTFDVETGTDRCFVSTEFCRIFGLDAGLEYVMSDLQKLIYEDDRAKASTLQSRTDGSATRDVEYRIRRGTDGAVRWIGRRSVFHADDDGVVRRMIGVVQDITERKLVEVRKNALIAFGDALGDATDTKEVCTLVGRTLGETLDLHRAGYCQIDAAGRSMTLEHDWAVAAATSISGRYPIDAVRRTLARLELNSPVVIANIPAATWMSDDGDWFDTIGTKAKITAPVLDKGKLVGLVFAHSATPRTWSAAEVEFVQTVADRSFAVLAKIHAEQHQHLLNQELSHRLKNTLSMVQAIAGQTLRAAGDKEAVKAFEDRIIALSRAHDVLLQQNWSAARIASVIESVSTLHGHGDHVEASGPNLTLGAKATLSFSLLLHELATNSLKYGALSRDEGRVELAWRVEDEKGAPTLVLNWNERGGPPAKAPTRRGFGTRLISMGLVGTGKANLDYAEAGLRAEFRAALSKVTET